jgi:hypothetical protein
LTGFNANRRYVLMRFGSLLSAFSNGIPYSFFGSVKIFSPLFFSFRFTSFFIAPSSSVLSVSPACCRGNILSSFFFFSLHFNFPFFFPLFSSVARASFTAFYLRSVFKD